MAPSVKRRNNGRKGAEVARQVPQPRMSFPTRVLSYLKDAKKTDDAIPQLRTRARTGVIHEAPAAVSRNYIAALCQKIPAQFNGIYSVIVFDITKATNLSDAMDICLREAEQSGPCVLLVDNIDTLYPKESDNELELKANVDKLLQVTDRTLLKTFVLFLGFAADMENLNPDLIKSGVFGSDDN